MTTLNLGDLVELHLGTGWLGTVLDVVESRPVLNTYRRPHQRRTGLAA